MDAIAAANTLVFALSVAACIAMLVAGLEEGDTLRALLATNALYQGGYIQHTFAETSCILAKL